MPNLPSSGNTTEPVSQPRVMRGTLWYQSRNSFVDICRVYFFFFFLDVLSSCRIIKIIIIAKWSVTQILMVEMNDLLARTQTHTHIINRAYIHAWYGIHINRSETSPCMYWFACFVMRSFPFRSLQIIHVCKRAHYTVAMQKLERQYATGIL